ncbi:hypothetical protein GCM10023238_17240 [Streptomyces heliomycini]
MEVLLQRVEHLGHGALPAAGFTGRTWTVSDLRAEVRERADGLAARFDARNGTTAHADRRKARLGRAPLLDALELTLRARTLDDVAPAAPVAAPTARTAPAVPESLPELILRARELDEQGHPDARACWARLRTLVAAAATPTRTTRPRARSSSCTPTCWTTRRAGPARRTSSPTPPPSTRRPRALYDDAGQPGHAALARACALLATAQDPAQEADGAEAKAAALTAAHASMVRLHEETSGLTPRQEARLLRLRATALGMRLQTSGSEEHIAPVLAEVDLLHAFATRHDVDAQISGALLLRATAHALSGDLPAALTGTDGVLDRLKEHGPAWHLPRALALRGRLHLGLHNAQAAYTDLAEGLRLAADWPADTVDASRLHSDLAGACLHLGRPDEALRHLTRSAEIDLRLGNRFDAFCTYGNAAQLSLDLGRVEDCIALLDSVLAEPDVTAGELDDRLVAQLRLTRARALHAGEDLKAATAEFVALAAESAAGTTTPAATP